MHPSPARPAAGRSGFSLTELLVASGIGLIVMGGVATLLGVFGRGLTQSQSTIDLSARMRAAAWKLRQDLEGVTCPVRPWLSPDANAGYFEISEGPRRDSSAAQGSATLDADTDDILMFTTRAPAGTFVGRYGDASRTIEAPDAEVAWFCRQAADQPVAGTTLYNLYRRQLLVMGYVGLVPFEANSIAGDLPNIDYDISLRAEGGRLYPNSLGDLTKRENRFMHDAGGFPFGMRVDGNARLGDTTDTGTFDKTDRVWEDVILTNVISFDVRVFDPQAKAQVSGTTTLYPGDPGYTSGVGAAGAYIDLGGGQGGRLAQPPDGKSGLVPTAVATGVATYDTWSQSYTFVGSGLNDPAQYTRAPPYPVPLEGVEVRIRCYDPTSKQVRQVSVRHTFRQR
jgi:prepilin-type N-terminal cleavage/methylation domain-containing protein